MNPIAVSYSHQAQSDLGDLIRSVTDILLQAVGSGSRELAMMRLATFIKEVAVLHEPDTSPMMLWRIEPTGRIQILAMEGDVYTCGRVAMFQWHDPGCREIADKASMFNQVCNQAYLYHESSLSDHFGFRLTVTEDKPPLAEGAEPWTEARDHVRRYKEMDQWISEYLEMSDNLAGIVLLQFDTDGLLISSDASERICRVQVQPGSWLSAFVDDLMKQQCIVPLLP